MDDAEQREAESRRAGAFALAETQKARIPSTRSKERDMPLRAIAAELGLAVRMNDRTMQSHIWEAYQLSTSRTRRAASGSPISTTACRS